MDKFETIAGFSKAKESCPFCKTPLSFQLTNYIGAFGGLPILKEPLQNDRFLFKIEKRAVKSDVCLLTGSNTLMFDNFTNGELPNIDEHLVKKAFDEYSPYLELYCPNEKCDLGYSICTHPLAVRKKHPVMGMFYVDPIKVFAESIHFDSYVVVNCWEKDTTKIYSSTNEEAKPIVLPALDFTAMGKERLINRIRILVTFS
jgi:hypothetical protein